MIYNKEQALNRCDKYHNKTGKVYKNLKKVLNTDYPVGTNLVVEFLKTTLGTPYGARSMCMDRVVDCAELPRIAYYIFFGKDIGSYSDAQYYSRKGKIIGKNLKNTTLYQPLDLIFYNTSKNKKSGHVSIIFNDTEIIQSGAREHRWKVGISNILWYARKVIRVKRFLSNEEMESVIVGNAGDKITVEEPKIPIRTRLLRYRISRPRKYMRGEDVLLVQKALLKAGFDPFGLDGVYGSKTKKAVKRFQKARNLKIDGIVGKNTWAALFD